MNTLSKHTIIYILALAFVLGGIIYYTAKFSKIEEVLPDTTVNNIVFKNIDSADIVTSFVPELKNLNPGEDVLVFEKGELKMAIFDPKDFSGGGPNWIFPRSGTEKQGWLPSEPTETIDLVAPDPRHLPIDGIRLKAWLFYEKNDTAGREQMVNIIKQIEEKFEPGK